MAFGVKIKKVKFSKPYPVTDLYEAIKDVKFTAGQPYVVKYMGSTCIVFPPMDSHNQVQILVSGFKKPSANYVVQKGDELTAGGAVKNMVMSDLTGGLSGFARNVGGVVKECERLVDVTYEELMTLKL